MKDLLDIHTHSLASGHAHSTLYENIQFAKKMGLKYYGLSDHAPGMAGTTREADFHNFKVVPRDWDGMTFMVGSELNILDDKGTIDLSLSTIRSLDYTIASLHTTTMAPNIYEYNTNAYLNVMEHDFVTIIGHPDDGHYDFDHEAVIKKAKEKHKLIELNSSSLKPHSYRLKGYELNKLNLELCMKYHQPIIINSDAHFCTEVGNHQYALELLKEVNFPDELVVNFNEDLIKEYLHTDKLK